MTITANDARDIADRFLAAATKINEYLKANGDRIGQDDYKRINEAGKELLRKSGELTTEAVGLSIDEMEDDARELKELIGETEKNLAKLDHVRMVIRTVAGLVDLASAIMAKDPRAVFKTAKSLAKLRA